MHVRSLGRDMRVLAYIYDSETGEAPVEAVLERLADREEAVERHDVAAADDRRSALRDAMLTIRESIRIGTNPEGIYDADGDLDFSAGVLITEDATGRRSLYTGAEALDALPSEADDE